MKRILLFPAVFVFLIGAAYAGYRTHWLSRAAAQPASAADMFADLPANTSPAAIYIDVKALRAAPFFAKLAAMAPDTKTDAEYSAFVAATGFHYETDLDQIAVVTTSSAPSNEAQVIVQGRFDEQKIAAYAQTHGKIATRNGHTSYEFKTNNPSKGEVDRTAAVEFLSPNRLRVTSLPATGGATPDTTASSANAASTRIAMRDHISRLSDSAFFAVFHVDNLKGMNGSSVGPISSPQISAVLRSIQWVTLTGNPETGNLRLAIEAECDDAAKAQQLSSGMIALKTMAPMFLSQPNAQQQIPADAQRAITDLISSSQIKTTDTRVKFSLVLTQEMLDVMSSAAKTRAQAGH